MAEHHADDHLLDTIDVDIRCPVETRILAVLRTFITCLAQDMGFTDEQISQIEMAVDEACANVMRHAYKHLGVSSDLPEGQRTSDIRTRRQCTLRLRVAVADDHLRISIIDQGIGMHRMPPGVNSVQEYQERGGSGGLGIYIIRNFMDKVEFRFPKDAGTELTMTKFLHAVAQAAE